MDKDEKKQIINSYPHFKLFTPEVQSKILEQGKINRKNSNQVIREKGSICNSIDIVLSGSLNSFTLSESGTENVVFNFERGAILGGNLVFSPSPIYPMTIFCKKDCTTLNLSRELIVDLLDDKEFAIFFITMISKNAQSLNKKVLTYTQNTLRENIIEYIQELAVIQRSNTVRLQIPKAELATLFGVQRQSLFRELKKMSDEGIITSHNKEITIL
ncbi:MAG: Crp/Fnr family transcriptional regulator [Sphaerochaetaceae bacterium]|nr:Crp/Fnr family transcriptional regulator [Sphaerochaetaceae bacterium]